MIKETAASHPNIFRLLRPGTRPGRPYRARRMHFYIDTDLEDALDRWSTENGISKSGMVRIALRAFMAKHPKPTGDALDAISGIVDLAGGDR